MQTYNATVRYVYDGDTLLVVDKKGVKHRVRIFGIDCPELDQPYGEEAKTELASYLLWLGEELEIEVRDTDKYGREICYVECAGEDVGLYMLREGAAWVYTLYAKYSDEYLDYKDTAENAKALGCGLWSEAKPVPPWRWRYKKRYEQGTARTAKEIDLFGEMEHERKVWHQKTIWEEPEPIAASCKLQGERERRSKRPCLICDGRVMLI